MAGSDITITFQVRPVGHPGRTIRVSSLRYRLDQTRPELVNKAVAIIRGPKVRSRYSSPFPEHLEVSALLGQVSASLGAILLMQELSELIQIPVCRLT